MILGVRVIGALLPVASSGRTQATTGSHNKGVYMIGGGPVRLNSRFSHQTSVYDKSFEIPIWSCF